MSTEFKQLHIANILVWAIVSLFVLTLAGMIVGAPFALSYGYSSVGAVIYKAFSPLCHQLTERSFHLAGHPFAVCTRCTGIYAGVALATLLYPLVRSLNRTDTPRRIWLLLAAVPITIDWALGFLGIWANTHYSRLFTGAVLGAVCAFFIIPGMMDLLEMDWRRFFKGVSPPKEETLNSILRPMNESSAPTDYGSPTSRI